MFVMVQFCGSRVDGDGVCDSGGVVCGFDGCIGGGTTTAAAAAAAAAVAVAAAVAGGGGGGGVSFIETIPSADVCCDVTTVCVCRCPMRNTAKAVNEMQALTTVVAVVPFLYLFKKKAATGVRTW
jgi:hypothetical protein